MLNPARLLGFAFANADMLFEVDAAANIAFATGAVSEFVRGDDTQMTGRGAARLFEPADGIKFVSFAKSLREGGRAGPLMLKLANGKRALVALCRLPHNNGSISCTLTNPDGKTGFGVPTRDNATGLAGREGFLDAVASVADGASALTLIDVPGLPDACASLPEPEAGKLLQRIGDIVREAGPKGAGRIGETAFGAVARAGKPSRLAEDIAKVLEEGGFGGTAVAQTVVNLAADGLSSEQRLLALRHVVGRFANGKQAAKAGRDLVSAFDAMIEETQNRALELTDCVLAGDFKLAFQPIVDLATLRTSHHEALARFSGSADTGETVAFAEQLGIADAFDVAVVNKALQLAEANSGAHVAFNLSGLSVCTPATFGVIAGLLAAKRHLAPQLLVELTESSQITDLAGANQALQALRRLGYRVGLDDFGAGAASFQYLHAFEVDFVKFDAALVRDLGKSRRDDMLIGGLVKLCRELGVVTVAEGVEDSGRLGMVRALGFERGQGWYLGKPAATLPKAPEAPKRNLRRKGASESWG